MLGRLGHLIEAPERSDYAGSKLGMWLFLASEILLFTGPLLLFAAYRYRYPGSFAAASAELDIVLGTANTMVLLTSSLFMALAIGAVRRGRARRPVFFLYATAFLGGAFLVIKTLEWAAKFSHGLYPGSPELAAGGAGGAGGAAQAGEAIFFGLYFFTTGLHALHIIVGIALLLVMAARVRSGVVNRNEPVGVENTGLYWHLVDIIWVYIYQLFYIIG